MGSQWRHAVPLARSLELLTHLPRRIAREAMLYFDLAALWLSNRISRASVTMQGSPVVSLTTYGKRARSVYLAIESIASGRLRPSRIILWLDDKNIYNNLPGTLIRLQKRGLEIKLCNNYGPHTKYYPYIESEYEFHVALVTADDDIIYHRDWHNALVQANAAYPDVINCWWTHRVTMQGQQLLSYLEWETYGTAIPSFANLMLGVMGVCYPPGFLVAVKNAGGAFKDTSLRNDDLWLHVQAIRSGYRIRQICVRPSYFIWCRSVPGTNSTALSHLNNFAGENDKIIKATYSDTDIHMIYCDVHNSVA